MFCDDANSFTSDRNPLPVLVNPQAKTICANDACKLRDPAVSSEYPCRYVLPTGRTRMAWVLQQLDVNVPMGTAGTAHILDVLTNTTSAPITVTYQVTPTSGAGCVGVTRNIVITVTPRPVLVTPQTKTICSGQSTAYEILLTPANQPAATFFSWPDPDGVGPATARHKRSDGGSGNGTH